jgi:hypothetical protein
MAGLARWGKTNELLRARLVERGWSHDNPKGLPRTISPARDFAIVATTGDAVTGYPGGSPSTKYAKGIQTVRAIGRNFHQLAFDLPDLFAGEDRWDAGDDLATWLLLYHVTPDQVRAELSLANGIDRRGHVSKWIERIILPAVRTDECPLVGTVIYICTSNAISRANRHSTLNSRKHFKEQAVALFFPWQISVLRGDARWLRMQKYARTQLPRPRRILMTNKSSH